MKKLYAAYGSNLNLAQMAHRCPTAVRVGLGYIDGYRITFRGREGNAVANIEPYDNYRVPVLVWQITESDERNLDIYEGFPRLYRKEYITVRLNDGKSCEAMVYVINYGDYNLPNEYYFNTILHGYITNGMDTETFFEACYKAKERLEIAD